MLTFINKIKGWAGIGGGRAPERAAVLTPAALPISPLDFIDYQRRQIRQRDFTPLGRLARIDLGENCIPNTAPDNPLVGNWTTGNKPMAPALDWFNKGPMLAVSRDEQDVIVCTRMIHPPPINMPGWGAENPVYLDPTTHLPVCRPPRTMEQSLLHRCYVGPDARWQKGADGKWRPTGEWCMAGRDGEEWMWFMPITQILVYLAEGGIGIINCRADYQGRHTTLLYDRHREEGHIVFGLKDLGRHLQALTPAGGGEYMRDQRERETALAAGY